MRLANLPVSAFQTKKLNNSRRSIFKFSSLQQFTIEQKNKDALKFWNSVYTHI